MSPGALPRRLDSQRVFPHPSDNGFIRDTSPCFARSLDFARTFFWIYNPRKAGNHHHSYSFPKKDVFMQESAGLQQISKIPSNQHDPVESARFSRIGKISPNQPDSSNPTDTRPRLSTIEPSPSTACHSSRASALSRLLHQEAFRTSTGSWAIDRAGPEPL